MRGREFIGIGIVTLGLACLSQFSFTGKQRRAIRDERDESKCQAPWTHQHSGRLEVHHILPQGYLKRLGVDEEVIDTPANAITLCQEAHVGKNGVHPDIALAREDYRNGNKRAFADVHETREKLLEKREIYWDDTHDRQMQARALQLTSRALNNDWSFPGKNGNGNGHSK